MIHSFSRFISRLFFHNITFSTWIYLFSTRNRMDKSSNSIMFWRNTFRLHNFNSVPSSMSWLNAWIRTGFHRRAPQECLLLNFFMVGNLELLSTLFPYIATLQFPQVSNVVPKFFPILKQWSNMWTIIEEPNLPKFQSATELVFVSQENVPSIEISTKFWNRLAQLPFGWVMATYGTPFVSSFLKLQCFKLLLITLPPLPSTWQIIACGLQVRHFVLKGEGPSSRCSW